VKGDFIDPEQGILRGSDVFLPNGIRQFLAEAVGDLIGWIKLVEPRVVHHPGRQHFVGLAVVEGRGCRARVGGQNSNGSPARVAYPAGSMTRPRWPNWPPPPEEWTDRPLEYSSRRRSLRLV
jgi:hypothetical protein